MEIIAYNIVTNQEWKHRTLSNNGLFQKTIQIGSNQAPVVYADQDQVILRIRRMEAIAVFL